ncbi:Trm112 family protein [Candidatus Riesia pediculischaeffi]|uniref:Uncharacterized protein n=1 Tax=Candidatus Riesia pediculischaeffi PTSU TaxID=1401651 RepID=A0A0C1S9D5_9ENTR|nr:Trm112 family protein [Candidatus Riesia pediculischaeffi]KIE63876.1 hypothetical protein P689_12245 [Candidatus Riesia pediculischaeffi PTSU]
MDEFLFKIIACPICTGKLIYSRNRSELFCKKDNMKFPIRENILIFTGDDVVKISRHPEEKD